MANEKAKVKVMTLLDAQAKERIARRKIDTNMAPTYAKQLRETEYLLQQFAVALERSNAALAESKGYTLDREHPDYDAFTFADQITAIFPAFLTPKKQ